MNLIHVFDTETQGLPDFKSPSEAEHQPHLVQLASVVVDTDTWTVTAGMNVIIKPEGWVISDEVAAIHGITQARALAEGVSEELALRMFLALNATASYRVAHNVAFDDRIIRIAMCRYMDKEKADEFKALPNECTALLATPICKIPPTAAMLKAGRRHYKTANLGEAYKHFTGKDLQGAHNAMADVLGCLEVYKAIKSTGVVCE